MLGREVDLMTQVEQRTMLLIRECQLQKQEVQRLTTERDMLLSQNEMYVMELSKLSEKLSLASFALSQSPEARAGLMTLQREIQEITSEVDVCIALLQKGVK